MIEIGLLAGKALKGLVTRWREVVIALLAVLCWQQASGRWDAEKALAGHLHQQELAQEQSARRGAETGTKEVTAHVDRVEEQAPVVARVVTRLRNVCLREPATPGDLPVPEGARAADAAGVSDGDAADRAFVAAAERDLAACASELSRLQGLQAWARDNGG